MTPPDKTIETVVGEPVACVVEAPATNECNVRPGVTAVFLLPYWAALNPGDKLYRHPAPALTAGDGCLTAEEVGAMERLEQWQEGELPPYRKIAIVCAALRRHAPGVTG